MEHVCFLQSPIGILKIRENNGFITGLCLLQGEGAEAALQNQEPPYGLLSEARRQLMEYFAGKREKFDLPLAWEGTAFQQRVWKALLQIPYGETRSYADIAAGIGSPKAVRAVGQANGKNPILILVPCHRVIHKDGSIDGFACGMEVKRFLLELERKKSVS